MQNVIQVESLKSSKSSDTTSEASNRDPPSMKIIGERKATSKSSASLEDNSFIGISQL
jgi:hypothetical protein